MIKVKSWYVLFVFSLFSMSQAMSWFCFSSVPAASAGFYALSESEIALLLNWGCIVYIVVAIPLLAAFSTASPVALRRFARIGAALTFTANILRDIPTFVPCMHTIFDPYSSSLSSVRSSSDFSSLHGIPPTGIAAVFAKILLHVAQILNAAAGPVVMSPVSLLSELYFTPNLYVLTTNIAYFANGFGTALLFVIGPALAPTEQHMPYLMLFQTICATLAMFLSMVYFPLPDKKRTATRSKDCDSNVSVVEEETPLVQASDDPPNNVSCSQAKKVIVEFFRGAKACLSSRDSAVATLCTGIQFGFVAGWAGCLPTVLMHLGVDPATAGLLGVGETGASLASSLAVGVLAVTPCLSSRYRALSLVLWSLTVICFICVALFIPFPWTDTPVISPTHTVLFGICFAFFGFAGGGITPLYYEILAELTYPVSPSTSAGLVAWISNAATLIVIALSPVLAPSVFLAVVLVVFVLCAALCAFLVRVRYFRREAQSSII